MIVDDVWAGTHVRYDAVSVGKIAYVAYFDADRQLCVARVDTVSGMVLKRRLGSTFGGWDAHNSVTLAYDKFGYLHVAGNMHTSPLVYARTQQPDSFDSLTRVESMVGHDEVSVTYPKFIYFSNGDLGFTYRSGKSGDGVELINKFDGRSWSRLSKAPLFSSEQGEPTVNAYHTGYVPAPDGYFHVAWVWRLNRMVESNFDVNYAKSKDLEHWFDSRGEDLPLPLTPRNADLVDRIPPGGGLYNNVMIGFDAFNVPIISYLKYDESGYTQLYHARPSQNGWQISKVTNWDFRWELKGAGTLVTKISFSGVHTDSSVLTETVKHPDAGSLVISYTKDAMKVEKIETGSSPGASKCRTIKPWTHVAQSITPASADAYRGRIMYRSLPKDNNDQPRSCHSIGLAEGCRMTSKLIVVPATTDSSVLACAP